ncbi:alpha-methylacyl-CoA racemase isoform X2 [Arctopsyche grandis]
MALKGIKVVEMLGLAPGPFCGMLLAEFGATVVIVDKIEPLMIEDVLGNGKRNLALNLKSPKGVKILRELVRKSDVLIEPFRPGVMEKLGLGPNILMADNPRLIYARLTGYGQYGEFHKKGGHDINYVSLSGLLSMLGRKNLNPMPPINYAADFAGGGMLCAMGIAMALFERSSSNKGQIIDSSMVEGTAYTSSWIFRSQKLPIWGKDAGENILDGGAHFYNTYKTKDGEYMAVGSIEPKFYAELLSTLNIKNSVNDQFISDPESQKEMLSNLFITRTKAEWDKIFEQVDACVTPVLTTEEAAAYPHNKTRGSFTVSYDGKIAPTPAPRLSRTPASSLASQRPPRHGEHTEAVLSYLNYSPAEIAKLNKEGAVYVEAKSNL